MIEIAVKRLEYLCTIIPQLLTEIGEPNFSLKVAPEKWSKKELIGHLIDSATNNHHRFVQIQFESKLLIPYDQNQWNRSNFYQQIAGNQIIDFWTIYNKQLVEIIKRISEENLLKEFKTTDNKKITLFFLINDYVEHLEHHLKQVVIY